MSARPELRIGLVMYGGLSLAVYMSGMTQEILALVRASHLLRLQREGSEDPWVRAQIRHNPYCRLLEQVRVDVVVDVIAGTSAGGLNGLMLAKALAGGAPDLSGLTELWEQEAQIETLASQDREPRSLLSGDFMRRKLEEVMEGLSQQRREDLARQVEVLDLFVTATDLRGHVWKRRDGFDQQLEGVTHRYLFHLKKRHMQVMEDPAFRALVHGYDRDDFMAPGDPELQACKDRLLAKIGRATSAFPGIFPPVRITRKEAAEAGTDVLADVPLPERGPDGEEPGIWFSDGGILVNKPFKPVLDTIAVRSAHVPVKRALVFLEPDPAEAVTHQREPHILEAVVAGLTLPMNQDIKEHLDRLNALNRHRQQLHDLIEALDASMTGDGEAAEASPAQDAIRALQQAAPALRGAARVDDSLERYYQLRARQVRDVLEGALTQALGGLPFRSKADRERAHRAVLEELDRRSGGCILGEQEDPAAVRAFLERYDTPFQARRVQFLLSRIHKRFTPGAAPRDRAAMERLLKRLWCSLDDLRRADWMLGHAGRLTDLPPLWHESGARLNEVYLALAEAVDERACRRRAQDLVDEVERFLDRVRGWATERQEAALRVDAEAALPLRTPSGEVLSPSGLLAAWQEFEPRDVILFLVQVYGEANEWDPVTAYRFSPKVPEDIAWVNKPVKQKLAGEALGHIAAFFDRRWRANDIMWGRLDAVDVLTHLVLKETEASDEVARKARAVQAERRRQILLDFEEALDLEGLAKVARKYGVRGGRSAAPGLPADAPEVRQAVRQAAAAAMPDAGAAAGRVSVADLPEEALQEYLTRYHKVGEETLADLPPERLSREMLLLMRNGVEAVGRPGPGEIGWLQSVQKPLATVMRLLTWSAEVLLRPRQGLLRVVQENVVWLMAAAAAVLLVLQGLGATRLSPVVWVGVLVLLFPQLFRLLFRRFRRLSAWAAGGMLAVTAGLRLLLWDRVTEWWPALEPAAAWAARADGVAGLWPLFTMAFALLLLGGWMVPQPPRRR